MLNETRRVTLRHARLRLSLCRAAPFLQRNAANDEKRPPPSPKSSELPKTLPSDQQSSMPMLVSPEESGYFESVTDDDAVSQRPEWINKSYSQHIPNLMSAETQAKPDPGARAWDDDRSVRPAWMNETESVAAQSERPGWINQETESVDVQSERPGWINGIPSVHAQSQRPAWMDDTESVAEQSQRPGWINGAQSVDAQSQRPGWMDDAESVAAQSVRPGWMDDTGSVAAQSVRPGWMDDTGSVAAQSVRPGWMGDTDSVAAQSARPGWMEETGSVDAQSVRPGWMDDTASGIGGTGLRLGSVLDKQESARPGWMGDGARSQRPEWLEGAAASSMGGRAGSVSPKTTLEHRSTSPEVTRGGQSSSEFAAR